MRRFLANKFAFGLTLLIFALGLGCNALFGGGIVLPSHSCNLAVPAAALDIAHGPSLPPDPNLPTSGNLIASAHGPSLPPDPNLPTSGNLIASAHGPSLPPDPNLPTSGNLVA